MVATSRLYVTVSYGSCVVAASDLYSTVSYGGAVQTPGAMCTCRGCTISQQNRVVRTSVFGCLNWAGSISLCARFKRLPLGFSDFFLFFFFCVDVGNRTNVTLLTGFFVQEHILAKFGALRARSFNSRDRSLSLGNRYRSLHGRACMCV